MKIKWLLLALGCSVGSFGAYAQKGVDIGTRFGSAADSVRCITNINLFTSYAKAGNFKDAYEFWKIVYNESPAATKDLYLYGVKIMDWKISNEKDPAKRAALINDLMGVYDKRVKYFGDDKRYGKDWIVARKVQDYYRLMGDKADTKIAYNWLKEVLDKYDHNTEILGVSLYMFASRQILGNDPNFKEQYIQDYLKCTSILDTQIKAAKAANNEKELSALTSIKSGIDNAFATSGAVDCETLQNLYAAKVEEHKADLPYLRDVISLLRRVRCQDIDVYFAATGCAYKIEPTADAAVGIAKQAVKQKDYDTAIKYFEEAANMEPDNKSKADDYYMIALLHQELKNFSRSRDYCMKVIELDPNNSSAYLLIGSMYVQSAKNIYPNDDILARTVYYAALDKFEKAKQVDPRITEEANKLINVYRAHLPSTEEIFMHPDLEKGKTFAIGGWIGERVTIR